MSRTWIVNQKHPRADDSHPGTPDLPLQTIHAAAQNAEPGDTVLVYAGVYRERVAPARGGEEGKPILYRAADGETVVVKGSEIFAPQWETQAGNVYAAPLPPEWLGDSNPFATKLRRMPGEKTLGQVFVKGVLLTEVDSDEELRRFPGTYRAEAGTTLFVHFPESATPENAGLVEVSVRGRIFAPHRRGLGYIHIVGLTFEHCANQFPSGFWTKEPERGAPQAGAVGTRSGHHWRIERCTVRHAKGIGIDCGSEGGYDLENPENGQPKPEKVGWHVITRCTISDNGCCGIAGWDHEGTQITHNTIERNNCLGFTAPETGGIKVHGFINGLIEGNLLRDNDCFGIWLDNVYYHSRVTRNVCVSNRGAGIFVEMGDGPVLVDHNILALTRTGDGIYSHDASGATYAHNLLFGNSHFGIYIRTATDRQVNREDGERVPVESSRNRIIGNVFVDNWRGHQSLPFPSEKAQDNESDYNLYIGGTQWHWEGLGLQPFVANDNKGLVNPECLAEAYRAAQETLEIPADEWIPVKAWRSLPYLTLEQWQAMTGWDKHSHAPAVKQGEIENGAVEKGGANLSPYSLYVEFRDGTLFSTVSVPPIAGMETDFHGVSLTESPHRPGPFQTWTEGHNRHLLW
ncbi:MAG: hypothetical protein OHK0029_14080 [Armatimonadaceae bacterium]